MSNVAVNVPWLLTTENGRDEDCKVMQLEACALANPSDKTASATNANNEINFEIFILCCNSPINSLFKYFGVKRTYIILCFC